MAFLAGYDTVASYVTFIVNEDRFPCYDGKGADYIPDPIISADAFNRSLRFSTRKPGFVDVDWGGGTKDQYPLVKVSDGSYRIVFRSLDIEYKKNPDDTVFNFNWCNIPSYDPAFNSIPAVYINIVSDRNNISVFDEVDKVGDDKAGVAFMGNGSSWKQDLVGGKLNKIQQAYCSSSTVPVDDLPDYLYEIREFRVWNLRDGGRFINTQERADTFVNTFYDKIMSWSYITMSQTASDGNRNQFYKLTLDLYAAVAPTNKRPSGVYQAPDGFVKGVSNGNPTTPMEKVYVLTNNYGQTWILAPAPASRAALTRARRAGKARITPFVLGVKDGHVSVFSGDVLDDNMSKYNFADKYEAIDICNDLGLDSSPIVEYFRRIEEGEV